MTPAPAPPPILTPKVVTSDQALAIAVDAVIQADATDQGHLREIGRLQAELRAHVDEDAWHLFLQLDEAIGARLADLSVTLTCWAFVEGQWDGGRGGGGAR